MFLDSALDLDGGGAVTRKRHSSLRTSGTPPPTLPAAAPDLASPPPALVSIDERAEADGEARLAASAGVGPAAAGAGAGFCPCRMRMTIRKVNSSLCCSNSDRHVFSHSARVNRKFSVLQREASVSPTATGAVFSVFLNRSSNHCSEYW